MELAESNPQKPALTPEDKKLDELYQLYLQKCCEIGQIEYQLEQLDNQRKDIEKSLDTTRKARNKASNDHRELQKTKFAKLKIKEEPSIKLEMDKVSH